jgi:hypothetical protein
MPTKGGRAAARPRPRTPAEKLKRKAQAMSFLALEALAKIMVDQNAPAPVKLAAAREVMDRAHGRPKLGGESDAPEGLTVIVKRFSDVTPEDEAEADATEARL